jgi:hypothetical protein
VIWNDIVVVGELFMADHAYPFLFGHLSLRSFRISARIEVLDISSDGEDLECVEYRALVCRYSSDLAMSTSAVWGREAKEAIGLCA